MKKYTLSLILCFAVASTVFAQNKNVRKAQSALDKGDLGEAQSMIDQAVKDDKTKDDGKTWFTYGEIYKAIAMDSTNSAPKVDNPYEMALKGYDKSMQLEKEGSQYYTLAQQMEEQVWANNVNEGATLYQNQDFEKAMKAFDVAKMAKPKDTTGYIYAGISAQQAGDLATAAKNYEFLIDSLDYQSKDFYNSLIFIYTSNEDTKDEDKAMAILQKAEEQYPEDGEYLKNQITMLINDKKYDEAEQKLDKAIQQEPDNAILYYNRGYLYEQMDKGDQAIENYTKAVETDPNYFDANFNLAAYYYNQAAEILTEANNMDLKEYQKNGKEIEANAKEYFEKSLPYLEKSEELKPDDPKVLSTLQTVYTRLGMDDKAQEIESKLNGSGK